MLFSSLRSRLCGDRTMRPGILDIGCSMVQGVPCAQIDIFADGVAIKEPGAECFRLLRQFLDGVLLVISASVQVHLCLGSV